MSIFAGKPPEQQPEMKSETNPPLERPEPPTPRPPERSHHPLTDGQILDLLEGQ